jgi:hypothetical protein
VVIALPFLYVASIGPLGGYYNRHVDDAPQPAAIAVIRWYVTPVDLVYEHIPERGKRLLQVYVELWNE